MKLKQLRVAKGIEQVALAKKIRVDVGLMSKFENYKALPTPRTMKMLEKALECEVGDIYERSEITFVTTPKRKKSKKSDKYHLSAYIPAEARELLPKILEKLGYRNITDWLNQVYKTAKNMYELEIRRDEK